MIYSFVCPIPCYQEILIDAINDDDAVIRLITAGALRCRNARYRCRCDKSQRSMSPIADQELKRIVRICMQEKQGDYEGALASSYG